MVGNGVLYLLCTVPCNFYQMQEESTLFESRNDDDNNLCYFTVSFLFCLAGSTQLKVYVLDDVSISIPCS